jgi:hypothetical protein
LDDHESDNENDDNESDPDEPDNNENNTLPVPDIVELDPNEIRFSQSYVNDIAWVEELETRMREYGWTQYGLPAEPIDVVRMQDGQLTSLDNRRVLAARRSNIRVRARVHDFNSELPTNFTRMGFPTTMQRTWGNAIQWRILSQTCFNFKINDEFGSFEEPYVRNITNRVPDANTISDILCQLENFDLEHFHVESIESLENALKQQKKLANKIKKIAKKSNLNHLILN